MKNSLITVVVPVYNMGKLLPKAIDCLLQQTYKNYEILIIDDGSNDGSSAVCDDCALKSSSIRVVHKENGGLSSARNCGIENANGEFIIFPDPDDWVENNYLQQLVELHEEYNSNLEIGGHYVDYENRSSIHNEKGKKRLLSKNEALKVLMLPFEFCGFAWNKLYHLDIINKHQLRFDTELGMAQDLHFAFRYLSLCEKIAYNPSPTYHYFQHIGGVTNAKSPLTQRKTSGLKTYEKIAELAGEENKEVKDLALSTIFNMSMHFVYIYYLTKMQDKELLKKLKNNLKTYKKYFFADKRYSASHRLLGRIVLANTKLYYLTKKLLKG
ncbi:MAG: glycosyltransferase family 2 protein [Clostridia bacterium]|nr:glycosyltransferase family 2 protein [Clostridia bacterium]